MTERILCPFCRFTEWFYYEIDKFFSNADFGLYVVMFAPVFLTLHTGDLNVIPAYFMGLFAAFVILLRDSSEKRGKRNEVVE